MDVLCFAAVFLILKLQTDETPVWAYLLSIQLIILGLFFIGQGSYAFING